MTRIIFSWLLGTVLVALPLAAEPTPTLSLRPSGPPDAPLAGRADFDPGSLLPGQRLAAGDTQQVRLAVLLVEFPPDTDPATTGDGTFDLSPSTTYPTNQPPHDHAYFDRQCRAVESYFGAASNDRLLFDWTIFPASTDDPPFFQMPNQMRYYNPDTTDTALDERLAEFFRDAVEVGDAGGVPFDEYTYVVIFHAGVGQDLLFDDPTPSDIPSAFLSFDDLRSGLGEDESYEGISVQGGTHFVREGLWLPETENQAGFEFGLTGVFAQLLGSQFGIPILFNPDSGAPGVGDFGLMDQGGGNLDGMVPAYPTAWSRFDRGWEGATVVTAGKGLELVAKGLVSTPDPGLILIPVDEREYFLIENRQVDLDDDGQVSILYENTVPIAVGSNEYDAGIPGSGVLIWHIDQAQIDANRDANRVNADFEQRGVKLLEADGSDDIGLRPEGGFGLAEDCYYEGNNTALTPTSNPSSRSNYGADTHVSVTNIGPNGNMMTLDVSNDRVVPGWPDSSATSYDEVAPVAADVDGDGELEWIAVDSGVIAISGSFTGSFTPPGTATERLLALSVDGTCADCAEIVTTTEEGALRVFDSTGATIATLLPETLPVQAVSVVAAVVGADPVASIFAAKGDQLYVWRDGAQIDDVALGMSTPARFIAVYDDGSSILTVVFSDDEVLHLSYDGATFGGIIRNDLPGRPVTRPVFADLDRDGDGDFFFVDDSGSGWAIDLVSGRELDGWPRNVDTAAPPSLGDLNGDGRPEILVGGRNEVAALSHNGVRLEGWPVTLRAFGDAGEMATEVIVADVDADGDQDVIVPSPDGILRAYDGGGNPLPGWPLPAGRTHSVSPVVSAAAGGSLFTIGAGTPWSYAYGYPGIETDAHWPQSGGGPGDNPLLDAARLGPVTTPSATLPEATLYAYPNPAYEEVRFRYSVGAAADVAITIYDVSGAVVAELDGSGSAGVANEIEWDLRNDDREPVAPGIYVAAISAREGGRTVRREVPFAITR